MIVSFINFLLISLLGIRYLLPLLEDLLGNIRVCLINLLEFIYILLIYYRL